GDVYVFTIKDELDPACAASFTLESEDCQGGTCAFEDIIVEAYGCNDDGEFYVDIDFSVANPAGDEFELYVNNELFGVYAYSELPLLEIGPFPGDGSIYVFTFKDHTDPSCWASFGLESPDCAAGCVIADLQASLLEIGPNGTAWEVSLSYGGISLPDGYDIYLNGEFYTYINSPELSFILEIPCQNNPTAELKVCINDQAGCCETIVLNVPPCTVACMIDDLVVEAYDCGPDATFYVDLDLTAINPTSNQFDLYINGVYYNEYEYDDLPLLEIGPFIANGSTYTFLVMDSEDPLCEASFELTSEDCGDAPCALTDLYAEVLPCTSNGEFYVEIGFEFDNVGNDGFKIQGNGNIYGTFGYDELPVIIGPFSGDGATEYEFIAVDIDHPDCQSNYAVVGPIDCSGGSCQLTELVAELVQITNDGIVYEIDFNYVNTGNLGFDVFFENAFIGFYTYNDLP
ncbi:MAG: hypothetical protein AAFU60_13645, partial [Bacteroidota bacterium]